MSSPTWESGDYKGKVTVGKTEQDFLCTIKFVRGKIEGNLQGAGEIHGTYATSPPYGIQMELRGCFGHDKMTLKGNYSKGAEIFGLWYTASGAPGGDIYFAYKQLSPEEKKKILDDRKASELKQLMSMGFEQWACELAIEEVNGTVEQKLEWLINGNHEKDQGGHHSPEPQRRQPQQQASKAPTEENIQALMAMGFSREMSSNALQSTENNVELAVSFLFENEAD